MKAIDMEQWYVAPTVIDDEIIILNDCEAVIATVPLWQNEEPGDDLREQSKRNAMLIAAAPALFAAAALAEDALSDLSRLDDGTCSTSALFALRAVIATVQGSAA